MKRLLRLIFVLWLLVSTSALAGLLYLPTWLEGRILHALEEMGFPESTVTVASVRLDSATLTNIGIGADKKLSAQAIEIKFDPLSLFHKSIESITITGLDYQARWKDGKWDLGPLSSYKMTSEITGNAAWTLRQLKIVKSHFLLLLEDEPYLVPFGSKVDLTELQSGSISGNLLAMMPHPAVKGFISIHANAKVADRNLLISLDSQSNITATRIRHPSIPDTQAKLRLSDDSSFITVPLDQPGQWHFIAPRIQFIFQAGQNAVGLFAGKVEADGRHAAAEWEAAQTTFVDWKGIKADVATLKGRIEAEYASGQEILWKHNVQADLHDVQMTPAQVTIARLHGEFPGRFQMETVQWRNRDIPSITGNIDSSGGGIHITADCKPHDALPVKLAATVDASGAQFSAKLPPTELVDSRLIATLLPALQDLDIDGGIAATIDGEYKRDQLSARGRIDFEDATVQIHRWDVTAYGVGGSIIFDDLLKARTGPTQILTADRVKIGSIRLTDAQAEFQINSPTRVLLEQISCTIGDYGSLAAHAISIDTADFNIDTELYIENLNLGDWMSVLTQEKLSATGEIYGRVPVKYRPAEKKLELGNGYLYSGPEGGSLHVNEPRKIVDLLSQYDPRFAEGGQLQPVRIQAQEALDAFDYSLFRFDLAPEAGGGHMLRIETRGKGRAKPDGDKPLEIGSLVVNVHNFQQAVNAFMIGKLQLTPDQSVDRMLDRFFQNSSGQETKP